MIVGALAAGAVTALALTAFAAAAVHGLWRPDAFDYAQIARELAQGHGFSSRQAIYALHLEFLRSRDLLGADWPNLHRFPLPSLVMAAGFRLFGVGDAVVVGYGIVFQAATSALLFAWARAAIGLAAAMACVFLFTVNGTLLEIGCSGLAEPPVLCFFTLALYAVWRQSRSTRLLPSLVAGGALGLAALSRTNTLFVAPLFAVAIGLARRGPSGVRDRRGSALAAGALVLVLVAVTSPWWVRNALVAGDPFFSLHSYFLLPSGTHPGGMKWDLSLPWVHEFTSPLAFLAQHPGPVFAKWWGNLARLLSSLPTLADSFGLPLVALAAPFVSAGTGLRATARLLWAAFVVNAVLVSFGDFYLVKYHLYFLPGMILLAVGILWQGLARLRSPRLRLLALACAVLAMADLPGTVQAFRRVPASTARFDPQDFVQLRERTDPGAVIVSDQSYAVAWETGRRSIRVHYDRDAQGRLVLGVIWLQDHYLPIDAVYLSRQFLRDPAKLEILNRTLGEQPRFRREFPRRQQLEGGGLLLLHARARPAAALP